LFHVVCPSGDTESPEIKVIFEKQQADDMCYNACSDFMKIISKLDIDELNSVTEILNSKIQKVKS
jgi:hypothetical protein